ncbi:L,D-transpeptidase family protein [Actinospica durhamensis]|uniref:L,D-transpeptidase family protein n=1 Tax=Actinospica durhamensis TaxID=1508375 RepID=A0A941EIK0_9ACTN|nr:Ig-like domain-containing protein [Actinospica durhamensis]MBR7832157.1 L,D-transpeptidase family protein [Actinospica durhamensis]
MADAVAPGDGAEEAVEGADEAISVEPTEQIVETEETVEVIETVEVVETVEVEDDAAGVEVVAEAEVEVVDVEVVEVESDTEIVVEVEAEVVAEVVEEVDTEVVEAVDVIEVEAVVEAESESEAETEDDSESGPEAAATEIITLIEAAASPEPAPAPQAPAEPVETPEPAEATAVTEVAAAVAATTALPGVAQALASASFVPPQPEPEPQPRQQQPPQPPTERPTVTLAGRRFDRRAALVAGGVGVVVIGGAVAALASSGGSTSSPSALSTGKAGVGGAGASTKASTAAAVPLPTITTSPADGASGVDPSKPITVTVLDGTIASVSLSGQDQTNGTLSTDGSTWTSANALDVNSSYQLTVTAKNSAGKTKSSVVSFHTLKPSAAFGVSSVVPPRGSTVGVGQPIRVTFSNYVPAEYRAALEKACVVTTSPAVAGAWYWVSNSTDGAVLDWRPKDFWAVNTKVSISFDLNGVRLGEHQFGVKDYASHDFTIRDTDLRLIVDKDTYSATCYQNGKVIRTFPIDTGMLSAETFVTYTGTMSVLGKGNPVEMKGNYGPGDTYDDFVNWATQITWSGTYVHAAPWDGEIGHANDDSHGCVHCRTVDAEWFYNIVQTGDVVTINGSRKREVAVSNGICTFTLDWATLLKGSAYGATLNGKPVSA